MHRIELNQESVIAAFHEVLRLKDREVCASVDAANCQTTHDWRKSHEAADALAEAVERFEGTLAALTHEPPMITIQDLAVRYSDLEIAPAKQAIDAIRASEPAKAIARLAKIVEAREQASLTAQRERRTQEAKAIEEYVKG